MPTRITETPPTISSESPFKAQAVEMVQDPKRRQKLKNSLRTFEAASSRTDRSLDDRCESAEKASRIHMQLYGRPYKFTREDVAAGRMLGPDLGRDPSERRQNHEHNRALEIQNAQLDAQLAASNIFGRFAPSTAPVETCPQEHAQWHQIAPNQYNSGYQTPFSGYRQTSFSASAQPASTSISPAADSVSPANSSSSSSSVPPVPAHQVSNQYKGGYLSTPQPTPGQESHQVPTFPTSTSQVHMRVNTATSVPYFTGNLSNSYPILDQESHQTPAFPDSAPSISMHENIPIWGSYQAGNLSPPLPTPRQDVLPTSALPTIEQEVPSQQQTLPGSTFSDSVFPMPPLPTIDMEFPSEQQTLPASTSSGSALPTPAIPTVEQVAPSTSEQIPDMSDEHMKLLYNFTYSEEPEQTLTAVPTLAPAMNTIEETMLDYGKPSTDFDAGFDGHSIDPHLLSWTDDILSCPNDDEIEDEINSFF